MVLAHWMDFSLGKSVVGHSLNLLYLCLCTSYKDTFWVEGLWVGYWPYTYTGCPSWLQEVTISWTISFTARSLRLRHLHRHPGYSYCPRSLVHTRDSLPCPLPFCILSLLLYLHLITHNPALPTLLLSYQIPSFHSSLFVIRVIKCNFRLSLDHIALGKKQNPEAITVSRVSFKIWVRSFPLWLKNNHFGRLFHFIDLPFA